MTGNLAQRSPADVLCEVQRRQISGVLTFEVDRVSRQIFVDAGVTLRFAASNHPAEGLTGWFVQQGRISQEMLRRATLEKRQEELLGATLVRLGLIAPSSLAELTERHIRRVVREALWMRDGTYEMREGALPFREQLDSGIMTSEALLEWTRDVRDPDWIRCRLGSLDGRVLRDRRPPEGYQMIRLDPVEGYIMSRVDGIATIHEICMVSPMGDERTLCALLGLALAGILEMPAGAAELPAPAVRRGADPTPGAPAPPARPLHPFPAAAVGSVAHAPTASWPRAASAPAAPSVVPAPHAVPAPARAAGVPKEPPRSGSKHVVPGRLGGAGRPLSARPHAAVPPRPLRVATTPLPKAVVDVETEMLQRFENLHSLDLYEVLGVSATATPDDIRRAYYALARRFHPDIFRREDLKSKAEKVFARVTESYATLGHPTPRARYDEERQARLGHDQAGRTDTASLARMNFRHGRDHYEHGRLSEALSFLQNACQQDPGKAEYFEYLGLTQARNPRLRKQAEESLLRAIQIAPTSGRAQAHLGQVYERAGQEDKARAMYRKALQWDPTNEVALKGLEPEGSTRKGLLGLFSRK